MDISSIARAIWQAGVDSVKSDRLLQRVVHCDTDTLTIAGTTIALNSLDHIEVLGAGKAGRGMAAALVRSLSDLPESVSVAGHINVPADCAEALVADFSDPDVAHDRCRQMASNISVFAARPAGINEPTNAAIDGTLEILDRLKQQTDRSLTIFLVSGGGSALLEAPMDGISLEDMLTVTRHLARSGATIQELNTVRTQLSKVKGGGLLQHMGAGRLISLIVSDIIADPLPLIASGPTVLAQTSSGDAMAVLKKYTLDPHVIPNRIWDILSAGHKKQDTAADFSNHLIATNSIACSAAAKKAETLGLNVVSLGSENSGKAADFGAKFACRLKRLKESPCPEARRGFCLIAGGETTVAMLNSERPGKGGRNQEAALAALNEIQSEPDWNQLAMLFAGTDGEDGPTDAAGAFVDANVARAAEPLNLARDLRNHNAYPFFEACGGLLKTGPTHTNVMDLAIGVVYHH